MILTQTIPEQLVEIYFAEEPWHAFKMSLGEALEYHTKHYSDGSIHVYEENEEVLGYYERHFVFNVCFLDNVWVKKDCRQGKVFKELYRNFFDTMPQYITHIMGEKQSVNGKMQKVLISKEKRHGKH